MSNHELRTSPNWEEVAALAERLGVEPLPEGAYADLVLRLNDGRGYSVTDLINAVLDRLDETQCYETS